MIPHEHDADFYHDTPQEDPVKDTTSPSGRIGPVTAAAAAGTGVAGAAAIVLVWILGMFAVEVPAEVAGAFATLIGAVGALVAGKLVPPKNGPTWAARGLDTQ